MSVAVVAVDPREEAERQQRRASHPHASAWVEANAGTGKTKVLTDRIVRLLLDGAAPQRVLCLTFTKAAAAEMRNRLASLLGSWTLAKDDALATELGDLMQRAPTPADMVTARRLFARVLDAPGGISIQTIHSFCQSLLQRFPLEAGVAPNFTVLDEGQALELLQQAQDAQLALLSGDEAPPGLASALKAMAARVSEAEYVEIMGALLGERGRVSRLAGDPAALAAYVAHLRRELGVPAEGCAADYLAAGCADAAFDRPALMRAAKALARGGKEDNERAAALSAWLADAEARTRLFEQHLTIFFTQGGEIQKRLASRAAVGAMADIVDVLSAEARRLQALANCWRSLQLVELTAALLRLGTDILARYEDAKRARAALDYEDLVLRTRDLLGRAGIPAWVLYKLDGGIDHVLVDEAQDTNPDQWEVVRRLTEEFFAGAGAVERERTIFAVGDAKQSIFGFQRADPAKLAEMRQWFEQRVRQAEGRFERVELISSYRSVGAVLDAVDRVFETAGPAARGVAPADHAVRHVPIRVDEPGVVEVWPVVRPLDSDPDVTDVAARADLLPSPDDRLAQLIARHAKAMIDRGERLANKPEPIHAGNIMVLVRRRNAFVTALVRALKREGLPVAGVDRMTLIDELPVQDLMALGRFVLLPQDDLNLACLLKSPLVGLDEEALFDLAWKREGRLWAALTRKAREGNARYAEVHAILAEWLARADYTPPFEFFADILGNGHGRRKLLERLGREAADPIDEFLSIALQYQRGETPSLQGFMRALEQGSGDIKRDLEEERRREVRILTVHGAKGLQAPVVYLPDTSRVPAPLHRLLWSNDGRTLLWLPRVDAASDAARALLTDVRRRESEEQNRLLYVAMTRAADRLYVAGWAGARAPDRGCWYEQVSSAFAREPAAADAPRDDGRALPQAETFDFKPLVGQRDGWDGKGWRVASGGKPPPEIQLPLPFDAARLPDWARRLPDPEPHPPVPLVPSRPFMEEVPDAARRPVFEPPPLGPFAAGREARFQRGNTIHRLLRVLPELPVARRGEGGRQLLASLAPDVDAGTREAWLGEALAVLDLPDAGALFGPASRAEVPVVGMVALGTGPYSVSGQLDRLAITDHEVLIADFKTNRPPPADPDRVPLVYRRQMALYRALLGQIYPGKAVRCFLLWTDGPRLMPLPEAGLSAALP